MKDIEKAIAHFRYGIKCDIFSEPVTTYAKTAVAAIEKQIPKKPLPYKGFDGKCVCCGVVFLDRSTKYCGNCGQALDWNEAVKEAYSNG